MILQRQHLNRLLDAPFPRELRRVRLSDRSGILVTQFDKLGDVLCSTAAIGLLRRSLPNARIVVGVQPYSRAVLARNPDVDEVLTVPVPWSSSRFAGGMSVRVKAVREVAGLLRERRFDVGIDLQGNPLNAMVMALAGIPIRVGMSGLGGNAWLTAGQRMDWFANRVVFRLRLIERLVGRTGSPVTRFDFDDADGDWAASQFRSLAGDRPIVAVCPTAENPLRMWDEDSYISLGRSLADDAHVVVCHAPSDAETAGRFEAAWADAPHCHVTETSSLSRFGAALATAGVVVTGDSAPMHMAVAVGTPVVAMFGPSPPSAAGPFDWDYNRVLQPAVICKPCLWGPYTPDCDARFCMNSISVDHVARATRELIARGKGPASSTSNPLPSACVE